MEAAGQAGTGVPDTGAGLPSAVEELVARVLELDDDERSAIAEARRAVDEEFHDAALRAAAEALAGRGELYVRTRRALARAHLPSQLEAEPGDDRERLHDVARLVQLAIDDALVGVLAADLLHPKHVRELCRSFKAADEAAPAPHGGASP